MDTIKGLLSKVPEHVLEHAESLITKEEIPSEKLLRSVNYLHKAVLKKTLARICCLKCRKVMKTRDRVRLHLRKARRHRFRLKTLKEMIKGTKEVLIENPELKESSEAKLLKLALGLMCATLVRLGQNVKNLFSDEDEEEDS